MYFNLYALPKHPGRISIANYRSESFKFQVLKRSLFTNNFISAEINEKLKT